MGKRRIQRMSGGGADQGKRARALSKLAKKKVEKAVLHIESTFNSTRLTLATEDGATIMWSSPGALGFAGARKGTPFAAAKVGEVIGEKATAAGKISADALAEQIFVGLDLGNFYIYSHPQALASVQQRMDDILQARNPGDPFAHKPALGAQLRKAVGA